MENQAQKRYFAASNSSRGFINYFPRIFGEGRCRRLYVVKGGPGTGKSCFMRQVAHAAEERGYEVTYYYCSSDPDSLDGIVIDGLGVGIVDGTAPHVWEPTSVGAFEQLVNLGAFWNQELLAARREQIESLYREKQRAYREAYDCLAAYGNIVRCMGRRGEMAVDSQKLTRAAKRLIDRYASCVRGDYREETAICDSIGMSGRVRFDTYEKNASVVYAVKDCCSTAHLFMQAAAAYCRERGIGVRLSYHPIVEERIDALTLLDCGLTFVTSEVESEHSVNMRRFVRAEGQKDLRAYMRSRLAVAESVIECAEQALAEVRRSHFAVESLFFDAMDFAAKEGFTVAFCTKLFAGV